MAEQIYTEGKRTFWTYLADTFFVIGKYGPTWFRVLVQADLHGWALKHVKRQWYNGKHWIDRTEGYRLS